MNKPIHFQVEGGYASYRPEGVVSFSQAVELVSEGIVFCREQGIRKLLVNTTKLTGFAGISTWERFGMGERLAADAKSGVMVAMVAQAELIDPEKFGVVVAQNRGAECGVFTTETAALNWLLGIDEEKRESRDSLLS